MSQKLMKESAKPSTNDWSQTLKGYRTQDVAEEPVNVRPALCKPVPSIMNPITHVFADPEHKQIYNENYKRH